MSGSAHARQYKSDVPVPQGPKSHMTINMKLHKNINPANIKVGKSMNMNVKGKVVAHNHDEFGHTVKIELDNVGHGPNEGEGE